MIEIAFSPSFKKAFRKKIKGQPDLETKFWQRAEIFIQNPFDERLRTHKLSGKLRELWSFTIEYDMRVVFYFSDVHKVVFTDMGTHNEVY